MRLTTSPPSRAECHEIWEPKPPGTLLATPNVLRESFTFTNGAFCHPGFNFQFVTISLFICDVPSTAIPVCNFSIDHLSGIISTYILALQCNAKYTVMLLQVGLNCLQLSFP